MKPWKEDILYNVLKAKNRFHGSALDYVLDQNPDLPDIKNVCARLHVSLVKQMDSTCQYYDLSKRQFIEMAVINLINDFDDMHQEYFPNEAEDQEASEKYFKDLASSQKEVKS